MVSELGHHLLLVLAAAALLGAGLRLASRVAPDGAERAIATVALAAALAVFEALALGIVGWGGSWLALGVAAGATWIAAHQGLPRPAVSARRELTAWWTGLGVAARLLAGALAGAALAWLAWETRHPTIGNDGLLYHLPQVVGWVKSGSPGAAIPVAQPLPVEHYPLTNEVLLAWGAGLSRSLIVAVPGWAPIALGLLGLSVWVALRRLAVPSLLALLAVAAVVSLPNFVWALNGPDNDLPAAAWLGACLALCVASRDRPGLLGPALVAGALGVGTKTTAAPLALVALVSALVVHRQRLRGLTKPLGWSLAAGAIVCLPWYLRNLFEHGWPLWPFSSGPFGDPIPVAFRGIDYSFLDHPGRMLSGRVGAYAGVLAGGVVLLGGALLAPLLTRRRPVAIATAVTGLATLAWASAPYTGILVSARVVGASAATGLATGATRYLGPALLVAAAAIALAGAHGGRVRSALAALALASASAWSVIRIATIDAGFPIAPSLGVLAAGLVAGVVAAGTAEVWRSRRAPARAGLPRGTGLVGGAIAVVVLAGLLTVGAHGLVERHARIGLFDGGLVTWFEHQPAWREGSGTIAMSPGEVAVLTGSRLQHRLELIDSRAICPDVRRQVGDGWLVVFRTTPALRLGSCLADPRPHYVDQHFVVFGGPAR